MEFRGNAWTCKSCGGLMAGDFSSHDHPHAHCINPHCKQFNIKKRLPDNTHNPDPRYHVKAVGQTAPAALPLPPDAPPEIK